MHIHSFIMQTIHKSLIFVKPGFLKLANKFQSNRHLHKNENMKNLTLLFLIPLLTASNRSFSQAISLDPTFGTGGTVTTLISKHTFGRTAALQSDGKMVVAGDSYDGSNYEFTLVRYNPDGTLDPTFGSAGAVITPIGPGSDLGTALAIQPDGKLLLAGASPYTYLDFTLIRYNTDGTLDLSFNGSGIVKTSFAGYFNVIPYAIALQQDGKIVLAGNANNGNFMEFAVARYLPDGSLDPAFGANGKLTTSVYGYDTYLTGMALRSDGKVVVTGNSFGNSFNTFTLIRYNNDGSLDNSLNGNGIVFSFTGHSPEIYAMAIQPDNKILIAGNDFQGSSYGFMVARYNQDGTVDAGFGSFGKTITAVGTSSNINALLIQPDGKILAAGSANDDNNANKSDFAMARYLQDGTLDAAFNSGGIVTTDIGSVNNFGQAIALQPDGKIILAGMSSYDGNYKISVARYTSGQALGVGNISLDQNQILLYPNPSSGQATLAYSLKNPEDITIQLLDADGRLVETFVHQALQEAGTHQLEMRFPESLPPGNYTVAISTAKGRVGVKVVKHG
jgi:uncharacterized delta-60 repeat protein